MPLAEARLLAIEELRSRGGRRRGCCRADGFRRGDDERGPISDFEARSSGTVVDAGRGFSVVVVGTSVSVDAVVGFSDGDRSNSDSLWWCCSRSRSVLKASALPVPDAALENSPAARACSLIATVVSEL
jgi:hypothetical protein